MNNPWRHLLSAVLLAIGTASPICAIGAPAHLRVASITRGDEPVESVPDGMVRDPDTRKVLAGGFHVGMDLPDAIQLEVPANITVVIASAESTATLLPNSIATFRCKGSIVVVSIDSGRTRFSDPLDFFYVNAGPVVASHHTTKFSFTVESEKVTVACTEGFVDATRFGSARGGPYPATYFQEVDRIRPSGRPTVTYILGRESDAGQAARVSRYRRAAARGDANAEVNLGVMYLNGTGISRSPVTAARLFREAADKGNAAGENDLGLLYSWGLGVPLNFSMALHYFQSAAGRLGAIGGTMFVSDISIVDGDSHQKALSAPTVTLRSANGTVLQQGVHIGEAIPQDTRIKVPSNVEITVSFGKTTMQLMPGAELSLAWSGKGFTTKVVSGKVVFNVYRGALDFFRVPEVTATARG